MSWLRRLVHGPGHGDAAARDTQASAGDGGGHPWASLQPLELSTPPMPLTADSASFEAGLPSRSIPRYLEPLGHEVDPRGPAGVIGGLLTPVLGTAAAPVADGPDLPVARPPRPAEPVVSRSFAALVRPARPVEVTVALQRVGDEAAAPGRSLVDAPSVPDQPRRVLEAQSAASAPGEPDNADPPAFDEPVPDGQPPHPREEAPLLDGDALRIDAPEGQSSSSVRLDAADPAGEPPAGLPLAASDPTRPVTASRRRLGFGAPLTDRPPVSAQRRALSSPEAPPAAGAPSLSVDAVAPSVGHVPGAVFPTPANLPVQRALASGGQPADPGPAPDPPTTIGPPVSRDGVGEDDDGNVGGGAGGGGGRDGETVEAAKAEAGAGRDRPEPGPPHVAPLLADRASSPLVVPPPIPSVQRDVADHSGHGGDVGLALSATGGRAPNADVPPLEPGITGARRSAGGPTPELSDDDAPPPAGGVTTAHDEDRATEPPVPVQPALAIVPTLAQRSFSLVDAPSARRAPESPGYEPRRVLHRAPAADPDAARVVQRMAISTAPDPAPVSPREQQVSHDRNPATGPPAHDLAVVARLRVGGAGQPEPTTAATLPALGTARTESTLDQHRAPTPVGVVSVALPVVARALADPSGTRERQGVADPAAAAVAAGVAQRAADGSVVFVAPDGEGGPDEPSSVTSGSGPVELQRAGEGGGGGATAAPTTPGGGQSNEQLELLAKQLYDKIRERLRAELRLDRERWGRVTDLAR